MASTLAMGQEKCSDLVLSCLTRARFCELIAPKLKHRQEDLYLMGLLSLMDAILEVPIGVVVEQLPLDPVTKAQLLGAKTDNDTFTDLRSHGGPSPAIGEKLPNWGSNSTCPWSLSPHRLTKRSAGPISSLARSALKPYLVSRICGNERRWAPALKSYALIPPKAATGADLARSAHLLQSRYSYLQPHPLTSRKESLAQYWSRPTLRRH